MLDISNTLERAERSRQVEISNKLLEIPEDIRQHIYDITNLPLRYRLVVAPSCTFTAIMPWVVLYNYYIYIPLISTLGTPIIIGLAQKIHSKKSSLEQV